MSSYWRHIVTVAISCIFSDIKRDIGRKSRFLHIPPAFNAPVGGPRPNIAITFGVEEPESYIYMTVKKFDDTFSRFDTILACDGRTNILQQHSPHYAYVKSRMVALQCESKNFIP